MKRQKGMLLASAVLCVAFAGYGFSASAAGDRSYNGTVTVVLNEAEPGESGGNGGGTNVLDKDRFPTSPGDDLVTILKPDIPLAELGPLPQTGSNNAARAVIAGGSLMASCGFALTLRSRFYKSNGSTPTNNYDVKEIHT